MAPLRDAYAEPLREVGGYRVVRTLATNRYADRLLVHADGHTWSARVFTSDCPDDIIDHDLAVSDAARSASSDLGRHVSLVHDLSTTDGGRVALIEEYLAGPRLDALLRVRHLRLALGEAVTMLAPLVKAIEEGHRVGLTGLLLDPTAVRMRASGAPVLTRRSTVRIGPPLPERFRDRESRYSADRDALERVSAAIAAALPGDEQSALLAVMRRSGTALDHALFDLAPPLPVRFESEPLPSDDSRGALRSSVATTARTMLTARELEAHDDVEPSPLQRARVALAASLDSLGLPAAVVCAVQDGAEAAIRHLARATAYFRRAPVRGSRIMRARFVIAGVAGAAAMVVAITLAGQAGATDAGSGVDGLSPNNGDVSAPAPGPSVDSSARGSAPGLAETELHPELETWPALVEQLVARWIECAPVQGQGGESELDAVGHHDADATADCAAAVVHEGSAAAVLIVTADPRHRLLLDWRRAGGEAIVVERMGAAVLLDLLVDTTATASLLVVRSEAGWRIRDVIG